MTPEITPSPTAPAAPVAVAVAQPPVPRWRRTVQRFRSNRGAMLAACYLGLLAVIALMPGVLAPHSPTAQDLTNTLAAPFESGHLLGTDELGRDTLSRLIHATRVALLASGQAVLIGIGLGVVPGLIAGYGIRGADAVVMRLTDTVQCFPLMTLAIAIVGILGPSVTNAMIAVGVVFAPMFVRITRAAVLEVREETYVEASRSIGTSTPRILVTRVFPNAISPLLVQISFALGLSILAEASLSFLGLGVQLPDASWGTMLRRGFDTMDRQIWLAVFPGVMIGLTVLAFNAVGDGLRDATSREIRRGGR